MRDTRIYSLSAVGTTGINLHLYVFYMPNNQQNKLTDRRHPNASTGYISMCRCEYSHITKAESRIYRRNCSFIRIGRVQLNCRVHRPEVERRAMALQNLEFNSLSL